MADYVSRCHNSAKTIEFDDLKTMYTLQSINTQIELNLKDIIIEPSVISLEEIIHESSKDEIIKEIIQCIESNKTISNTNTYNKIFQEF